MTGIKKFLYCKNVQTIKVPQIKLLGIKEILSFGRKYSDIDQYLPSYKYNKSPNRNWL